MKQIYILLLLTFSWAGYSQITVKGKVTSSNDGTVLPYVNITATSTEATTSDEKGNYTITVTSVATKLTFSYLGFKTKSIVVGNQTQIDVVLEEESEILNEVVVTALGLKRESKELGYAVQKLSSEALEEVKTVNFLDNLAGKVAGVTITQGPTGVGSSSKIS